MSELFWLTEAQVVAPSWFRSGQVRMLGGLGFEGHGAFPAWGRVFAAWVVEAVDVFEEGNFDLTAGLPASAPDQLRFEGFEETFDGSPRHWACTNGAHGSIIAVSRSAHGRLQAMLAKDLLVVVRTISAARCPATVCLEP